MHYCETCKRLIKKSAINMHEYQGHTVNPKPESYYREIEEQAEEEGGI